jgi:hypothetical protein
MAKFDRLGKALDRQAWLWLQDADEDIAAALEAEVTAGADPASIRRFIVAHVGVSRVGMADRCEAAARHLAGNKG